MRIPEISIVAITWSPATSGGTQSAMPRGCARTVASALLICGVMLGVSGCNNAKSPATEANDVAAAQQKAANEVASAQQSAAKTTDNAQTKVDEKAKDLDVTEAKGAYDVSMAKADGDHKVATEKCMALAGDAQKACKDQADAKYELAKANAKAALAAGKSS